MLATEREVEDEFLFNDHRIGIWQEFITFRSWINQQDVPMIEIWLDGSFLSKKIPPNDLDLVIYLPVNYLTGNFGRLEESKKQWSKLHIFWVGPYDKDDELTNSLNQIEKFRWFSLFTEVKGAGIKGFVQLSE